MSNGLSSVVQTGVNPKVKKPGLLQNVGNTDFTKLQYPGNWRDQPFVQATIPGPNQPLQPGVSVRSNILTGQPNTPQNPQLEIRAITAGDGGALGSIVRTGINFPIHVGRDLTRLGKFLATTQGILFTANQQILSQASVRSTMYKPGNPVLNDAVYLPTSTLAQVAVSGIGGHLYKQGLNPFPSSNLWDPNGGNRPTYLDSFKNYGTALNSFDDGPLGTLHRRLARGTTTIQDPITQYRGGPGSILGVGRTTITRAEDRYGDSTNVQPIENYTAAYAIRDGFQFLLGTKPSTTTGVSLERGFIFNYSLGISSSLNTVKTSPGPVFNDGPTGYGNTTNFLGGKVDTTSVPKLNDINQPIALSFEKLQQITSSLKSNTGFPTTAELTDFRTQLRTSQNVNNLAVAASLPYDKFNIEARTNKQGADRGLKTSYGTYTGYGDPKLADSQKAALDQITSMEMYYNGFNKNSLVNDLVQFRIEAINNDDPSKTVFMHFRAFLNGITDNYQGEWSNHRYVGRGENMYTYKGFQRSINFSFDVPAQSKAELGPMYRKLNYLASNLAPDYSGDGYMRGPLVLLTIGGYVYSLPGFITQLTYEIPAESSWEIAINDQATDANSATNSQDVTVFSDSSVKELPKMIKVTSFAFTPIHRFVPRKQNITFNSGEGSSYEDGLAVSYGQQRYIALANGTTPLTNLYDQTYNATVAALNGELAEAQRKEVENLKKEVENFIENINKTIQKSKKTLETKPALPAYNPTKPPPPTIKFPPIKGGETKIDTSVPGGGRF